MSSEQPARTLGGISERPLFRVFAYYVFLFASVAVLIRLVPGSLNLINAPLPATSFMGVGAMRDGLGQLATGEAPEPWRVVLAAVVALASACIMMLPVTWVYVQTRRKKGYQQSVVQTLIILPLVVAGVILLVQNSTALAFSLGGIVGAVSFRNTLRDTKDTIYIFLAIVVGLAAGVHAMLVAATISVSFNIIAIIMWYTDFGRVGATLEGGPAERRLRRAKAMANRTGGFVSMVDRELLKSMTPEQLDVLAGRARARQYAAAAEAEIVDPQPRRRDWTLRVEVNGTASNGREAIESFLENNSKRWEFLRGTANNSGMESLEYQVRIKKNADPSDFIARMRAATGTVVRRADLSE
ncbi:MAG: DUF4956 domain-containing protein [Gemmatimonadota bacterium]